MHSYNSRGSAGFLVARISGRQVACRLLSKLSTKGWNCNLTQLRLNLNQLRVHLILKYILLLKSINVCSMQDIFFECVFF